MEARQGKQAIRMHFRELKHIMIENVQNKTQRKITEKSKHTSLKGPKEQLGPIVH